MIYSHVSNWVLLTAIIAMIPATGRLNFNLRLTTLPVLMALLFIPLNQITLSGYIHTLTAQLSIGSLLLMAAFSTKKLFGIDWFPVIERRILLYSLAAASPLYYYSALGFTGFDAYATGFPGSPVIYILAGLAILALLFRLHVIALILTLTIIAPVIPLGESNNALDYLVDTWLAIYAVTWSVILLIKRT